jgi:hypothetical protein
MNTFYKNILFLILCLASSVVFASGPGFNDTSNRPLTSGVNPNFSVNVGIGSSAPGQILDVQGTVRTTNFTMTGQTPVSGYVLTASDSNGDATWSTASSVGSNYWLNTAAAGNVGISTTNTVGIGTTSAGAGTGLTVMNGNVGIGTWVPGQELDVKGTIRTTNFTMTGQTPVSGYVLTASDSAGDATWSTASSVGTNYWLNTAAAGNVGISTTNTVGIGTTSAGAGTGLSCHERQRGHRHLGAEFVIKCWWYN